MGALARFLFAHGGNQPPSPSPPPLPVINPLAVIGYRPTCQAKPPACSSQQKIAV